ncbi:MAG: mechanosensitive ion channel family protein [Chitinophagales bacterium]
MEQANTYLEQLLKLGVDYAPKAFMALLVLVIGWWVINRINKFVEISIQKSKVATPEIQSFVHSIVNLGLKVLLVISVAGILGIETTSFVGILAAMGFAVGLALQGNLSNFAAGVLILVLRPFKVSDEVKLQGKWLFVKEIQIFHTIFKEFDNTMLIIPNSMILNGTIQNLSTLPNRKMAVKVNVPYTEDFFKVKQLITDTVYAIPEIDSSIKPFMYLSDYGEHYIKLSLSFALDPKKYWVANPKVNDAVIKALYDNKIQVAYPTGVAYGEFGKPVVEVQGAEMRVN